MTLADLPALNAALNATAAVLLGVGWVLIRRGEIARHRAVMIAACCTSVLFLISYLTYHAQVGSVRFTKQGPIRAVYFSILLTHTVLAAARKALGPDSGRYPFGIYRQLEDGIATNFGVKRENVIMCDSKGVIFEGRKDSNE